MTRLRRAMRMGVPLGLLLALSAPAAPGTFDLPAGEAVEWLLEHNRDYIKAQADLEKARLDVVEASAAALPQLDFTATGTHLGNIQSFQVDSVTTWVSAAENNYSYGLSANQLLFSGSAFSAIGVARSYRIVAEADLRRSREALLRDFYTNYAGLSMLDELTALNQEMVARTKARFEDAKLLTEIGSLSRYDLLRSEVEYMNSVPALREAENLTAQAESALRLMLDLEPGVDVVTHCFELYAPVLAESHPGLLVDEHAADGDEQLIADLTEMAFERRPEVIMSENSVEGYRRAVHVYFSEHLPTLSAFANFDRSNQWDLFGQKDLWGNSWNAGLQLRIPLFNGFRTSSQVSKGRQDLKKARQDDAVLQDAIRLEVRTAYDELQRRLLDFAAWSRNAEAAQEGLDIARTRRENGAGSELELRDARTAMKAARANLAQARFDLQKARIELLHALGLLDQTEVVGQ